MIGSQSGYDGTYITGDPKLGVLQNNGGLTPTMALASDSPAIETGTSSPLASYDQRGKVRSPQDTAVDIGAFEYYEPQTIDFAVLPNRILDQGDFVISASATSGLPVTFTVSGNATVQQVAGVWTVHVTGAGSITITAQQPGDDEFDPAPAVARTFSVFDGILVDVLGGMMTITGRRKPIRSRSPATAWGLDCPPRTS